MHTHYETLSRNRIRLLTLMAIAFAVWMTFGSDIMSVIIGDKISEALSIFGQILFVIGIALSFFIWRKKFRGSGGETQAALEDELVVANARKAREIGFYILLIAIFLIYMIGRFNELTTRDIGRFLLIAGISVPLVVFAKLEATHA